MNKKFKKRLKLKKEIKIFNKIILVMLLIIFIQSNKYIKNFISINADKYINKNYINKKPKLSMSVSSVVKNSNIAVKTNNDDKFAVKEEKNESPIIYIYNTHQTEKYQPGGGLYKPTVMHASKYLSEQFNKNDLYSLVENRSINDVLSKNGWSYGSSYRVSRMYLEDTYKNNNSIKYFFDIHRDAGSHDYTSLCTSDTCYAKILFLIGLENPNYLENQKYAEELNKRVNEKVKGLSKGILQKQGKKVNGVYNQDFSARNILIEVGGENNTMEEVYNTLNILSDVLINFIKEEMQNGN